MKLPIYTFIALLITVLTAPAFAEKPEGEPKRYRVILEKKQPAAESTTDAQTQHNEGEITQNASDESEALREVLEHFQEI